MTKWIDKELLERKVILQQAAAGEHLLVDLHLPLQELGNGALQLGIFQEPGSGDVAIGQMVNMPWVGVQGRLAEFAPSPNRG